MAAAHEAGERSPTSPVAADAYTRMSVAIVCAVAAGAGLVACLAGGLLPWVVSRRLGQEARSGAVRTQVPSPAQRDYLRAKIAVPLRVYLISLLAFGGLALVAFIAVAFEQDFDGVALLALGITLTVLAAAAAGLWAIGHRLRPSHQRAASTVSGHWGAAEVVAVRHRIDEQEDADSVPESAATAAGVAVPGPTVATESTSPPPQAHDLSRSWRGRLGSGLTMVGTAALVIAICLITLAVRIRMPGAARIPGYIPDPRYYTPAVERGIDLIITAAGVASAFALVLLLVGALLGGLTRIAERSALAAAAADPRAPRPQSSLLRRYSAPRPLLLAQLLSGAGGAGLVAAITGRILAGQGQPLFLGTDGLTGWFLLTAVVAILLGWACQAIELVGGRTGRNRVLRRWPVLPADRRRDR